MISNNKSTTSPYPATRVTHEHGKLGTTAVHAPVTIKRQYRIDTDARIEKPYVARASYAPDVEHPEGTTVHSQKYKDYVSASVPQDSRACRNSRRDSQCCSNISCSGIATVTGRSGLGTPA